MNRARERTLLAAALSLLVMLSACRSGIPVGAGQAAPDKSTSPLIALYTGPLNHLRAVRRGSCPMHPSCSEYARLALAAYGPVKGWILAMDRLLRCGRDETRFAPIIYIDGEPKFHDPLPGEALGVASPEGLAVESGKDLNPLRPID